jgi:hypothetical protein
VIPDGEQLKRIAEQDEGSLAEVPFAVLLHAHYIQESTLRLEIRRKIVAKEIVILDGVPVECRSNLAHEALERFLLDAGMLDEATAGSLRALANSEGIDIAEAVLERGVMTPDELVKHQQKNLAKKLLDGFSWREGTFVCHQDVGRVGPRRPVNLAQLIVFGITRFTPQATIDQVLVDLVGERHGLNPHAPYDIADVKLTSQQRALIQALDSGPRDLEEVAVASGLKVDEFTRFVYALALTGIIVTERRLTEIMAEEEQAPAEPPGQPEQLSPAATTAGIALAAPSGAMCAEVEARRRAVRQELPSQVLQLRPDDPPELIEDGFLDFAQRYSPWRYREPLHHAARDVFLAGVEAYCRLSLHRRRQHGGRLSTDEPARETPHEPELVDPDKRYRSGLELKTGGHYRAALEELEAAVELDPQSVTYRSEAAHCKFLLSPDENARTALGELREALRIDPSCGIALLYLGQIHERHGHRERAAECYRSANSYLAPDRRAIEALMRLSDQFGA